MQCDGNHHIPILINIPGMRLAVHIDEAVPCRLQKQDLVRRRRVAQRGIPSTQGSIREPALRIRCCAHPLPFSRSSPDHDIARLRRDPRALHDLGFNGVGVKSGSSRPPSRCQNQSLAQDHLRALDHIDCEMVKEEKSNNGWSDSHDRHGWDAKAACEPEATKDWEESMDPSA